MIDETAPFYARLAEGEADAFALWSSAASRGEHLFWLVLAAFVVTWLTLSIGLVLRYAGIAQ